MSPINERYIIFKIEEGKKFFLKIFKLRDGSYHHGFTPSLREAYLYLNELVASTVASFLKGAGVQSVSSAIAENGGVIS